jgi:hypothetical protein
MLLEGNFEYDSAFLRVFEYNSAFFHVFEYNGVFFLVFLNAYWFFQTFELIFPWDQCGSWHKELHQQKAWQYQTFLHCHIVSRGSQCPLLCKFNGCWASVQGLC